MNIKITIPSGMIISFKCEFHPEEIGTSLTI